MTPSASASQWPGLPMLSDFRIASTSRNIAGVATAKRIATDQLGATPSIWSVITHQVEPQMIPVSRNGKTIRGRSSA